MKKIISILIAVIVLCNTILTAFASPSEQKPFDLKAMQSATKTLIAENKNNKIYDTTLAALGNQIIRLNREIANKKRSNSSAAIKTALKNADAIIENLDVTKLSVYAKQNDRTKKDQTGVNETKNKIAVIRKNLDKAMIFYELKKPNVSTDNTATSKTTYVPTEESVYRKMIALERIYPEGMRWTDDEYYAWKGGVFNGGTGCAAFVFRLSDAAFSDLPARKHTDFDSLKVGDIVRIDNDTHFVIILTIDGDYITVAEGNYDASIHWGREFYLDELESDGDYILTRYPE